MNQNYRQKCLAQKINTCNVCGTTERLVVHHLNGDRDDNRLENLIPVCRSCHSTIHIGTELTGPLAELRSQLPDDAIRQRNPMGTTTNMRVKLGTWKELNQLKQPGDTFDDVLQRLLDEAEDGAEGNPKTATATTAN